MRGFTRQDTRMRPTTIACLPLLLAACATSPGMPSSAGSTHAAAGNATVAVPAIRQPADETAAWWYRAGAARAAGNGAMRGRAKNVVVFLGDGMSLVTVAAARILEGQRHGRPGEENALSFERFPHTALSKTYNTDYQTPDSAGTMTAIATGAKTKMGFIGMGQGATLGECAGSGDDALLSFIELAESAGLATGVVSTARLTHATPGSTYAHVPDRNWEGDADLTEEARANGCRDIASQLLDSPFGDGIEVALGGGRGRFQPTSAADPEYPDKVGLRLDGRDLVAEWQARHADGRYVWNAEQLAAAADAPRLFGLFEPSHMQYEADRARDRAGEPSLAELTSAAIRTLQRHGDGFVLLVEGGRIDHAHHEGNARRALEDTIAMSDAVRAADELTADGDTLLLVTADHAHTLHFAGYPRRGNPILDKVREDATGDAYALDKLGLPYTTLGYANGPGWVAPGPRGRRDLTDVDTTTLDYLQEAAVPLGDETHGGEDVGVWAKGPGADAVRGTVEQNVLFHFIVQAAPALRARLCEAGTCNDDGVPVELPRLEDFRAR
jgi:alkaline phosphatase